MFKKLIKIFWNYSDHDEYQLNCYYIPLAAESREMNMQKWQNLIYFAIAASE